MLTLGLVLTALQVKQYAFPTNLEGIPFVYMLFFTTLPQLLEVVAFVALSLFLLEQKWLARLFGYLIWCACISVMTIQLAAYEMSGQFLTTLALENINHILHLSIYRILVLSSFFLVFAILPAIIFERFRKRDSSNNKNTFTSPFFLMISLLVSLAPIHMLRSESTKKSQNLILKQNNLSNFAPIYSFLLRIGNIPGLEEIILTTKDVETAQNLGLSIRPQQRFPLAKEKTFNSPSPFAHLVQDQQRYNVIVFFMEGTSARLLGPYNKEWRDLTPNLNKFSEHPSVVRFDNYFNHTAATYRGLHGQLCSLWPYRGGLDWKKNPNDSSAIRYQCIPKILSRRGYDSFFLYSQRKEDTYLDELMSQIGSKFVLSGENLSRDVLGGEKFNRQEALSDQQFVRAVTQFFAQREHSNPFFAAIYNFETHAFLTLAADAVKYKSTKNTVLNSIHNFDNAFGYFWENFLSSKLYENTIFILTSDHAHFPEKPYVELVESRKSKSYKRYFFDRIPLFVYFPGALPVNVIDANFRSSIDLAPTVLHLLNFNESPSSFLGTSLFERHNYSAENIAVAAWPNEFYWANQSGIFSLEETDSKTPNLQFMNTFIRFFWMLENKNRIFGEE